MLHKGQLSFKKHFALVKNEGYQSTLNGTDSKGFQYIPSGVAFV